jgi:hypothetical protein
MTYINVKHQVRYPEHDIRYSPVNTGTHPTDVYTHQGFIDPRVHKVPYGSNNRDRVLYDRRRQQAKAENVSLQIDRPFN